MTKFKIFIGGRYGSADNAANLWLEENKGIHIISFQYQYVNSDEHSICIMYYE